MILSKPVLIIVLVACYIASSAQDLHLTKGNRTKNIEIGKIIAVQTPNSEGTYDKRNFEYISGVLLSVEDDDISLLLYGKSAIVSVDKKIRSKEVQRFSHDSTRHVISISKSSIKSLFVYGNSEKALKNRAIWAGIGNFVFILGLTTPWVAITFEDDKKQDGAMVAATVMVIVGVAAASIAQPKFISTSNDLRKNKKKKNWQIQ